MISFAGLAMGSLLSTSSQMAKTANGPTHSMVLVVARASSTEAAALTVSLIAG